MHDAPDDLGLPSRVDDLHCGVVGVVQGVGFRPFVWRLVIPWPQDGSKLHVFELTPVAEQPK